MDFIHQLMHSLVSFFLNLKIYLNLHTPHNSTCTDDDVSAVTMCMFTMTQSTVAVHLFLPFKADRSPSLYSLQLLCTSFFLSKQTGLPHCTVYSCCAPLSSFQSRQVSLTVQSTVAVHLFLPFKADRSPSLYSLQLLCTSFFLSKQTGLPHCTVYSCCAPFFLSKQTGLLTIQSTVNIAVTVYCCCAPLSSFQSRQVSLIVQSTVVVHLSSFQSRQVSSPYSLLLTLL